LLFSLFIKGYLPPILPLGCLIFLAIDLISGSNVESPRTVFGAPITVIYPKLPWMTRILPALVLAPFMLTGFILPVMWKLLSTFIRNVYARLALTLSLPIIWVAPWQSIISALLTVFVVFAHPFRVLLVTVRFGTVLTLNTIDNGKLWTMLLVSWLHTMLNNTYEYEPLDPEQRQFRILRLQARSLCSLVERELLTASITQSPHVYEAISYRWSSGWAIYPIVIDGKRHLVPRTVYKTGLAMIRAGSILDQISQ
jgi:hypothetical protein